MTYSLHEMEHRLSAAEHRLSNDLAESMLEVLRELVVEIENHGTMKDRQASADSRSMRIARILIQMAESEKQMWYHSSGQ